MKHKRKCPLKQAVRFIAAFFGEMGNDRVTVYAAQASYFIIISSVPFLILFLAAAGHFIDVNWLLELVERKVSGNLGDLINTVISEVVGKANIPFVSVTIITTLWTSSRGVSSITRGIGDVYGIKYRESFLMDVIRALIYTLAFILIILASIIALMFAGTIRDYLANRSEIAHFIFEVISDSSKVVFTMGLTIFFALLFNTVSKKGKRIAKNEYDYMSDRYPRGFLSQLPGAFFSAAGWVLFSYFYSLYLAYFPTGYYIYGSLAATLFLMLWLYSSMIILLMGAEINKFIFRERMSKRKAA